MQYPPEGRDQLVGAYLRREIAEKGSQVNRQANGGGGLVSAGALHNRNALQRKAIVRIQDGGTPELLPWLLEFARGADAAGWARA